MHQVAHVSAAALPRLARYCTVGAGVGVSAFELVSFDRALRQAGFADYNLLRVSSILPAGVQPRPTIEVPKGGLLPTAYGVFTSDEAGRTIAAAVSLAFPTEPDAIGVIMETEGYMTEREAHELVAAMAEEAMEDRNLKIARLEVVAVEAQVDLYTTVFAGVALW
ncbi:MAG: arginine decarboxylase, pyruvoyl-dependent [Fimbriimonadales bacterium]|nr:arginine decarboxylase, pyruvoyl-dependent [Fimbriimonadales bacterium]MCS7190739.1 arginine decarboxylase, pyruvoyl-dependent [Fimbriimonadales bacterium]